jgi:hypothetical protein
MTTYYQIHKKLSHDEFQLLKQWHLENNMVTYAEALGLWYPVKYGIENMNQAVRSLKNYSENNPSYIYRIVEVHYTTRSSASTTRNEE